MSDFQYIPEKYCLWKPLSISKQNLKVHLEIRDLIMLEIAYQLKRNADYIADIE